jgi:hypothetical protein
MISLSFRPYESDKQLDGKLGKFLDQSAYDLLINNKTHPEPIELKDAITGVTFGVWVPKSLPLEFCLNAFQGLREAATGTTNRGIASGESKMRLRKDGSVSKTRIGNAVDSSVIGYFDRYSRMNYCRACAWNYARPNEWALAVAMIEEISRLFKLYAFEKYSYQATVAAKVKKDWLIGDSIFSTVTVNKNFRTALHRDGLNLADSFSAFNVLRAGNFIGGNLVFPRYRIAISADNQDLLFFMPQEPHGNTEMKAINGKKYERISLVYYLRDKMRNCGTQEEELERGRRYHGGLEAP